MKHSYEESDRDTGACDNIAKVIEHLRDSISVFGALYAFNCKIVYIIYSIFLFIVFNEFSIFRNIICGDLK